MKYINRKKRISRPAAMFLILPLVAALTVIATNFVVIGGSSKYILPSVSAADGYDSILVLGAGLDADMTSPGTMLKRRLDLAAELMEKGASETLVLSGDKNGVYDETSVMRNYCIDAGVEPSLVTVDPEGFSTYESVLNLSLEYTGCRVLIVTQKYHLYRAVYIARTMGMDAYGIAAGEGAGYKDNIWYPVREAAARMKDFIICLFDADGGAYGKSIKV